MLLVYKTYVVQMTTQTQSANSLTPTRDASSSSADAKKCARMRRSSRRVRSVVSNAE